MNKFNKLYTLIIENASSEIPEKVKTLILNKLGFRNVEQPDTEILKAFEQYMQDKDSKAQLPRVANKQFRVPMHYNSEHWAVIVPRDDASKAFFGAMAFPLKVPPGVDGHESILISKGGGFGASGQNYPQVWLLQKKYNPKTKRRDFLIYDQDNKLLSNSDIKKLVNSHSSNKEWPKILANWIAGGSDWADTVKTMDDLQPGLAQGIKQYRRDERRDKSKQELTAK